ncbi:MAG: hypothetical protein LBO66_00525 [Deltaproteobacteria bacterium]|jgi:myo-inositol-1(or 4)-monophosphatase|nr:hypothetical protein [Deltaproteobacteria bacterium]
MNEVNTEYAKYFLDDTLLAALDAARIGSAALLDGYKRGLENEAYDFAGQAATPEEASASVIADTLSEAFPDFPVIFKTTREPYPESAFRWHVEPLDGALNYLRRVAFFSVSIALMEKDARGDFNPLVAVVMAPALMEMFWSIKGQGVYRVQQVPGIGISEGQARVTDGQKLSHAAIRSDRAFGFGAAAREKNLRRARNAQRGAGTYVPEESVSLGMAYVAAGRAEGFFASDAHPLEVAAGLLLIREAGGEATDFAGRPYDWGPDIVLSNGRLHAKLLETLGDGIRVD